MAAKGYFGIVTLVHVLRYQQVPFDLGLYLDVKLEVLDYNFQQKAKLSGICCEVVHTAVHISHCYLHDGSEVKPFTDRRLHILFIWDACVLCKDGTEQKFMSQNGHFDDAGISYDDLKPYRF